MYLIFCETCYNAILQCHRSLCTLVCKWTYCPPEGWDASFWSSIGLEDLLENNSSKIGTRHYRQTSKILVKCGPETSEHSCYDTLSVKKKKLCCFPTSRQFDVSPREPAGRRPHPGGGGRFGFGPRNCSCCFPHRCSRWRPRYYSINLFFETELFCQVLFFFMFSKLH